MPVPITAAPPRALLRDQVFTAIRGAIVDGTLHPGERLLDQDLCQWLNVSRTPVRDALGRLEQIGLVQIRPGRSTIVSPLDDRAAADAQAVVATLHELAAREAVPHLDADHLETLEAANRRLAEALGRGDVDAAICADADFHQLFVDVCANAMAARVLDDLTPLLRRMERARFAAKQGRESITQHRDIIDAARRGDATSAAALSRTNWLTLRPSAT